MSLKYLGILIAVLSSLNTGLSSRQETYKMSDSGSGSKHSFFSPAKSADISEKIDSVSYRKMVIESPEKIKNNGDFRNDTLPSISKQESKNITKNKTENHDKKDEKLTVFEFFIKCIYLLFS